MFCFSPKPLAFKHYLLSDIHAFLVLVLIASLVRLQPSHPRSADTAMQPYQGMQKLTNLGQQLGQRWH